MTQAFNLSQLANFVNSSGQLDAATGLTNTSSLGFPTGTLMLFQQTAAPTGWTKQTTHNNKALRVVSGTASSGGTSSFTDVFTNQTPILSGGSVASTTLSTAQLASHTHAAGTNYQTSTTRLGNSGDTDNLPAWIANPPGSTTSAGSGDSHTHSFTQPVSTTITLAIQYVDLIIASKN